MSQMWLDKLASATSLVERDEVLLHSFREMTSYRLSDVHRARARDDVEEQLRALADRLFPEKKQ